MKCNSTEKFVLRRLLHKVFSYRCQVILFLLLSTALEPIFAQSDYKGISGNVKDTNGEPLPGVAIIIKESNSGTVTDMNGYFSLEAKQGDVLSFSFIGYKSKEVQVDAQTKYDLVLEEDVTALEEVVVIGYGTQQKKDITGAIGSVSNKDIESNTISTADQALQGKVAGVMVSRNSFAPGGGISVRVRGTSSLTAGGQPLYVIDGVPITNDAQTSGQNDAGTYGAPPNPMNSIDPSQIQSIQVLKDASASAIYGSRAANGVVLITTKRGEEGGHTIDFDTSIGVSTISNELDFMTGQQWAEQANERADQLGQSRVYTDQEVQAFGDGTDWQDEIYRKALLQRYNLTFSGGNQGFRYLIGLNKLDQEGIIDGTYLKRWGTNINLDGNITDRLKIGNNLMVTYTENKIVPTDTKGYEGVSNVIDALYEAPPTIPARNEDGSPSFLGDYPFGGGKENPLTMTEKYDQVGTTLRVLGNIFANYTIIDGLDLNIRLGADINDFRWHSYYPIGSEGSSGAGGKAKQIDDRIINWVNANTLTYQKVVGSHNFTVLGGFTYQKEYRENLSAESWGFPGDTYTYHNLGLGSNPRTPDTYATQWELISYLGRFNYSLLDKYLLTASLRVDGSSKFGDNNKYGYFPSFAAAWQLGKETFIQDLNLFSNLKLRASFGKTGNESIGVYQSIATVSTSFGTRSSYIFNGRAEPIAYPSKLANPDLSWEKTSEWNFGLDMGFFKDRLQVTADYYQKSTTDLLLSVPVPAQTGFGSVLQNTGSLENKGFELTLNGDIVENEAFTWYSTINLSLNRNKVTSLGGAPFVWAGWVGGGNVNPHAKNTVKIMPGEPMSKFFGSVYEGIWQSQEEIDEVGTMPAARPGDIRYKDVNGDGTYDTENDDVYVGDANPNFNYGFTNNFTYRNLNLHVFIYGQQGNDILNMATQQLALDGLGTSAKRLDRWTPDNPGAKYPSASASNPQRVSSLLIEDGSFMRIGNVTLSYNLPLEKLGMSNAFRSFQIGVAADNLAVFTKYTGYDPEVNSYGNSNQTKGMDRFGYPPSRTFRVELKLGF